MASPLASPFASALSSPLFSPLAPALVLSAATLFGVAASNAQNLPWCAIMNNDGTTQCNYYTQQECLQTLSGIGGECILNPAGNATQPPQPVFPSSGNAQGLLPLQSQDPGPPPGLDGNAIRPSFAQQPIVIPDNLFTQAGFVVKYATTPEKKAILQSLPADKLVTRRKDGNLYYVYADAAGCSCAYVGTPEAFARYQNWGATGGGNSGTNQPWNSIETIDSAPGAPYVPADTANSMDSILDPSF